MKNENPIRNAAHTGPFPIGTMVRVILGRDAGKMGRVENLMYINGNAYPASIGVRMACKCMPVNPANLIAL